MRNVILSLRSVSEMKLGDSFSDCYTVPPCGTVLCFPACPSDLNDISYRFLWKSIKLGSILLRPYFIVSYLCLSVFDSLKFPGVHCR